MTLKVSKILDLSAFLEKTKINGFPAKELTDLIRLKNELVDFRGKITNDLKELATICNLKVNESGQISLRESSIDQVKKYKEGEAAILDKDFDISAFSKMSEDAPYILADANKDMDLTIMELLLSFSKAKVDLQSKKDFSASGAKDVKKTVK